MLAAVLAIHNITELQDTRIRRDEVEERNYSLELENEGLVRRIDELKLELNAEQKNSKELRRIIIDYEIAAKSQQEENQLNELESGDNDEVLQANAKERLPEGHTNVISGMPYTSITDKKSEQWALQLQAFTGEYGIRCYSDGDRTYFLAAMGSAYGREIGTAFRVTLKCGTEMYVMLGEFKDDGSAPFYGHPAKNYDGQAATCVLEFIYDDNALDNIVYFAGTFTALQEYGGLYGDGGDIVKIEYLGRKWEP
jgi:hypothetical protein